MPAARSASGTRALKPRKDMVTSCRFWTAKIVTAAANAQINAIWTHRMIDSPWCTRRSGGQAPLSKSDRTFKHGPHQKIGCKTQDKQLSQNFIVFLKCANAPI